MRTSGRQLHAQRWILLLHELQRQDRMAALHVRILARRAVAADVHVLATRKFGEGIEGRALFAKALREQRAVFSCEFREAAGGIIE